MKVKDIFKFIWNVLRNRKMLGILDHTDFIQAFSSENPETVGIYIGFVKYRNPSQNENDHHVTAIKDFVTELCNLFPEGTLTFQNESPVFSLIVNPQIVEELKSVGGKEEQQTVES